MLEIVERVHGGAREGEMWVANDPYVTNIAFGGPDMTTAYITVSGRGQLYEADWSRPGLRLHQASYAS